MSVCCLSLCVCACVSVEGGREDIMQKEMIFTHILGVEKYSVHVLPVRNPYLDHLGHEIRTPKSHRTPELLPCPCKETTVSKQSSQGSGTLLQAHHDPCVPTHKMRSYSARLHARFTAQQKQDSRTCGTGFI